MNALRVLVVATKSPYPPVGGGNAALHGLLRALLAEGVEIRVIAPARAAAVEAAPYPLRRVAAAPHPWFRVLGHLVAGVPTGIARYRLRPIRHAVEAEITAFRPHVVHVEQIQLAWLVRALAPRHPLLLREQNVESRIVARLAETRRGAVALVLRREARRIADVEANTCEAAGTVAAISENDAVELRRLAPAAVVAVLPAPTPQVPPAAARALRGDPPLLCLGSFDWLPNRDGVTWLVAAVWPALRLALPAAVLHLAGPGSETLTGRDDDRVIRHGTVPSPAALYDPRAIALVPVRAGSGVRLRILEAWSAGVPVVTTTVGGEGLVAGDSEGALLADDPRAFAAAVVRLAGNEATRAGLVGTGAARLEAHRPERVARLAIDLYHGTTARAERAIAGS